MKKVLLALVLVFGLSLAGYSGTAKSAISVDFGPTIQMAINGMFGIGAGYEFNFIIPNLSLALNVWYASYSTSIGSYTLSMTFIAPGLFLRFYPISESVSGLWIGAGYTYVLGIASVLGIPIIAGASVIPIDIGYKWIITGDMGFFVEPYVGYGLALGSSSTSGTTSVGGGIDYGVRLGLAF